MLRGTEISIHAPLTGRDVRQVGLCLLQRLISIHVPPTGHDTQSIAYLYECLEFQSTCPVRGTTSCKDSNHSAHLISIHAPLTGRDFKLGNGVGDGVISIHAPLTGRDRSTTHLFRI